MTGTLDLAALARRFPLVPRPQPERPPLPDRIAEIAQLARTPLDDPAALTRIAVAYNKAALIASDCGHPDLAAALCWNHHQRYTAQTSWTAAQARLALEPLVNLARLHIRAGEPDAAIALLQSLLDATTNGATADVDGQRVDMTAALATAADRFETRRWLWTVALAEGVRALTGAGRWDDALAHAQLHRGVGATLLDGRQAAVIAHSMRGDHAAARVLLESTTLSEPWQHAVARCLHLFLRHHSTASAQDHRDCCGADADHTALAAARGPSLFVIDVRLIIRALSDEPEGGPPDAGSATVTTPEHIDDEHPERPVDTTTGEATAGAGAARADVDFLTSPTIDSRTVGVLLTHPARQYLPMTVQKQLDTAHTGASPHPLADDLKFTLAAALEPSGLINWAAHSRRSG